MSMKINIWDIFEITTANTLIHGVMLRGRIRKFSIEKNFALLTENATDKENCVRFATKSAADAERICVYLNSVLEDASIEKIAEKVQNPVLSKLKVNDISRYTL